MSLSVISVHSCSGEAGSSIIGSQFPTFDGVPLVMMFSRGGGSSIIGMAEGGKDSGGTGIVAEVKLLSSGAGKASLALLQWHLCQISYLKSLGIANIVFMFGLLELMLK